MKLKRTSGKKENNTFKKTIAVRALITAVLAFLIYESIAQPGAVFIENKGQWNKEVKYKTPLTNGAFFLRENGFTVVQHHSSDLNNLSEAAHHGLEREDVLVLRSHAYEVSFLNSMVPVTTQQQVQSSYHNYFIGNDPAQWAANCKVSAAVMYKDIYPGIDVSYHSVAGALKYDLIIQPFASAASIKLQYNGVNSVSIVEGKLLIATSVGTLQEYIPATYTIRNGVKTAVSCNYSLSGNTVGFEIGNYNHADTLIIDPQLIFSTFTGSTADNWGNTATYGTDGSMFTGSIVFNTGFPVTVGAFQTTFNGGVVETNIPGYDIAIMKFNSAGTSNVYSTYLGGQGNETAFSLIADAQNNLIVAGRTSSGNFPTTQPLVGTGGGSDVFVSKLDASGSSLLASRKIGGSGNDGVNITSSHPPSGAVAIRRNFGDHNRGEVIIDGLGNIVLVSQTQSNDFPVSAGAFQQANGGNTASQDGVVMKLNSDLSSVIFSSYIGGSGHDGAFSVAVNLVNDNIYVAGSTQSFDFPGNKSSVVGSTYLGGNSEGFISIINGTGTSLIKTSYLGTTGDDMLYFVRLDQSNYPYVTGITTGNWTVSNAVFSQSQGKQFISKLQPDLSAYVYSTVFGKGSAQADICPVAFGIDNCENVYVAGWGGSMNTVDNYPSATTSGLTTTPGAIQTTTDGSDFYFFVLDKNATSQKFGTFFGRMNGQLGDHNDGGTSRFDANGTLYLAACDCSGGPNPFPTTPGSWKQTSGAPTMCNLAGIKYEFGYCSSSMPVSYAGFIATCSNNKTQLKWTTATEQNANRFEIEKYTVESNWRRIGTVPASNNFNGSNYSFTDEQGSTGLYRLKQIDNDGKFNFSPIVKSTCDSRSLSVYPVPATDWIQVGFSTEQRSKVIVQMLDISGRIILQQQQMIEPGFNTLLLDLNKLSSGSYTLRVFIDQKSSLQKLIIKQ
jgi:hypothetical protein